MATSGDFLYNPVIADLVDEAFENCGIDPEHLTGRHARSARRSINLMLMSWTADDINLWAVDTIEQTLVQDAIQFTMAPGSVTILEASMRRDGYDTEMNPISRSDYLGIPDKNLSGRPDRYYIDYQRDAPVVNYWVGSDRSTDVMVYNRLRQLQVAGGQKNTIDIPDWYTDAFALGLSMRLARKFAPARYQALKQDAQDAYDNAKDRNRETAALELHMK